MVNRDSLNSLHRGKDFIRQCQQMNFGEIVGLLVRDGEPVLGPQTELLFDIKLDSENTPRPESDLKDFVLGASSYGCFPSFDVIRNGSIEHIEIRRGNPRRLLLKTPAKI
jgi:hypothetical protein